MDPHIEIRLTILRLAHAMGGNADQVLVRAERFEAFVSGRKMGDRPAAGGR